MMFLVIDLCYLGRWVTSLSKPGLFNHLVRYFSSKFVKDLVTANVKKPEYNEQRFHHSKHKRIIQTSKVVSNRIGMKMSFNRVKIQYLPQNRSKHEPDFSLFFSISCVHLQFMWMMQDQTGRLSKPRAPSCQSYLLLLEPGGFFHRASKRSD